MQAEAGRPQIAYRETFGQSAKGEGRFIRQSVEVPQYGHACIKVEPLAQGSGIIIEEKLTDGVIPQEFIEPTLEGIREAAHNGVVAGYPVTDFKATLVDGSFHEVDSSEMALRWLVFLPLKKRWRSQSSITRANDASRSGNAR